MVPREPGQLRAIGAECRIGIEVATARQDPNVPLGIDGSELIALFALTTMILDHAVDPVSRSIDDQVGEPYIAALMRCLLYTSDAADEE